MTKFYNHQGKKARNLLAIDQIQKTKFKWKIREEKYWW